MSTAQPQVPEPAVAGIPHAIAARRAAAQGSRAARADAEDGDARSCSGSSGWPALATREASPTYGPVAPNAPRQHAVRAAKPRDSPRPAGHEVLRCSVRAWCVPTDPPPV